jgi:hypothetical protein
LIDPQKAIVEIPWYVSNDVLSNEVRHRINERLESALHMPASSVPVRYCDLCRHKLVGGVAVATDYCPRCGRSFVVFNP